jgi:hypothetical protein
MQSIHNQFGFLNADQIQMIDQALASLGGYGEVRLIVKKGTLRFVVTQQSHDALKWQSRNTSHEEDRKQEKMGSELPVDEL